MQQHAAAKSQTAALWNLNGYPDTHIPHVCACVCAALAASQLRVAKMRLWTEDRCEGSRGWGSLLQPETQTCAGYDNGYISTCFVSQTLLVREPF